MQKDVNELIKEINKSGIRNTVIISEPPKERPSKLIENRCCGIEPFMSYDSVKLQEELKIYKQKYETSFEKNNDNFNQSINENNFKGK